MVTHIKRGGNNGVDNFKIVGQYAVSKIIETKMYSYLIMSFKEITYSFQSAYRSSHVKLLCVKFLTTLKPITTMVVFFGKSGCHWRRGWKESQKRSFGNGNFLLLKKNFLSEGLGRQCSPTTSSINTGRVLAKQKSFDKEKKGCVDAYKNDKRKKQKQFWTMIPSV